MRSMVEGSGAGQSMTMQTPSRRTVVRARALRRAMTLPELHLWQILRARPAGVKFRRQHPHGPYILDFFCMSARVAIEVDGMAHDMGDNPRRDERRDCWLRHQGIRTLRFAARDVLDNLDEVLAMILRECAAPFPSTGSAGPPPRTGEEIR